MKPPCFILSILMTFFCAIHAADAPVKIVFESSYRRLGVSYITEVSEKVVESIPSWNLITNDPPLSVRDAIAIAKADLKARWPSTLWTVQSVRLEPLDGDRAFTKWLYEIEFHEGSNKTSVVDSAETVRVVVLMNGRVVTARKK